MEIMINCLKLTNNPKILVEIVRTLLLLFSYRPVSCINFDVIVSEVVLFASRIS